MIKCFAANKLVLNMDKINIMIFIVKTASHSTLYVGYKEKVMQETVNTKFLGLQIDNHINWKNPVEQIIP
jgi:hypothetical protein